MPTTANKHQHDAMPHLEQKENEKKRKRSSGVLAGANAEVMNYKNSEKRMENKAKRQARSKAACGYDKNKAPKSKNRLTKYTKSEEVWYPWQLRDHYMKHGLLYYLQDSGRTNFGSEIANNVLRAILIEYNKRFPHHNVIEYYVAQNGVNWPYYFWSEFRKATSEWMTNCDPDGKKDSGSGWFAKPGVVSDAQKAQATDKKKKNNMDDDKVLRQVVDKAFRVPLPARDPASVTPARTLRDHYATSNESQPDYVKEYTPGVVLICRAPKKKANKK